MSFPSVARAETNHLGSAFDDPRTDLSQLVEVVVDLGEVPYMDSSGLATLVEAMQIARKNQGKLIICALQQKVRSIFEIARLDMVFKIVNTRDEALAL